MLTRNEVTVPIRAEFARIDTNDDGELTQSEIAAHADTLNLRTTRSNDFQMADLWMFDEDPQDGPAINRSFQHVYKLLSKLDKDDDGELSDEELGENAQKVIAEWASRCFQRLDQDENVQISRQEAQGSLLKDFFGRMDQNGDGALSRNEVQSGLHEHLAAERPSAERQ